MRTTTITCDIEGCGAPLDIDTGITKELGIIFTTEQTEGRSTRNHICSQRVDLCPKCYAKVLEGNYIFAHGAQGYNTYYFKEGV